MPATRRRKEAIVCRYLTYRRATNGQTFDLPMVHLRIGCKGLSLRTTGLIDSGSTSTFVPVWVCESLGLEQVKEDEATGAGGTFPIAICKADLELLKGMRPFLTLPGAYVMVPKNSDAIPYAVLGRDILFNQFKVTFDERARKAVLRSY